MQNDHPTVFIGRFRWSSYHLFDFFECDIIDGHAVLTVIRRIPNVILLNFQSYPSRLVKSKAGWRAGCKLVLADWWLRPVNKV